MQINFLNYLSCTAAGRGVACALGYRSTATDISPSTSPWCLSSLQLPPFPSIDLTHKRFGSERARRYWGCVPSKAEQSGPIRKAGVLPYPQSSPHCSTSLPTSHSQLTKSTRSSASQWKHLRKRRRVKSATKRGLKSSRKTVKARQVSVTAYQERSKRC